MSQVSIQKEKDFQKFFTQAIKYLWWWIHKMPDVWNFRKPFDAFVSYKWHIKAVELKIANTHKTNVLRLLKDHQIENLKQLYPNAYVVCYFKKEKATSLYKMQPNWELMEIVNLKRLLEVCDYLLWINSKHS